MDDRLLEDYLQELRWLRAASGEFSRQHPKIAARLRLSEFDCPDPHVERLLEGFALQSARLNQRLDEGFSELSESLLELLTPHLLRPYPSFATARFTPDPLAGDLTQGYTLPAGTPLKRGGRSDAGSPAPRRYAAVRADGRGRNGLVAYRIAAYAVAGRDR